jgi:hypothetical protein
MQELRQLAAAKPGQIWLVEHDLRRPLAAGDRDALTSVNVVLYERVLAPLVASVLPIGAYAEPLPANAGSMPPALSPRAIAFAGEGWSVVQVVEAGAHAETRARRLAEALVSLTHIGDLPVLVGVKPAAGRYRELDASLRTAPDLVRDLAREGLLTLVLGPLPLRFPLPGPAHAFAANGLAG